MSFNIAIDGPAGAGKSTIAKRIAKKLGILYLDTGAMYRGVAYYMINLGIAPDDEAGVCRHLDAIDMNVVYREGEQKVLINGNDVTPFIRTQEIGMAASTVSKIPAVRLKLVELQRIIARHTDCVLDGRDIGSYVLPDADLKIFLTASAEERAKRRMTELEQKGQKDVDYNKILSEIQQRDQQDSTRSFAPLVVAEGAILLDTTRMNIDQVEEHILSLCKF